MYVTAEFQKLENHLTVLWLHATHPWNGYNACLAPRYACLFYSNLCIFRRSLAVRMLFLSSCYEFFSTLTAAWGFATKFFFRVTGAIDCHENKDVFCYSQFFGRNQTERRGAIIIIFLPPSILPFIFETPTPYFCIMASAHILPRVSVLNWRKGYKATCLAFFLECLFSPWKNMRPFTVVMIKAFS